MSSAFLPLPLPARAASSPSSRPQAQRPLLLATYSHLKDRKVELLSDPDASMRYHRRAPLGADLSYGFDERIERNADEAREEHLDGLVNALMERGVTPRENALVTWRGMLTRLLTAAYEDRPWEMTAVALEEAVYLEDYVTDAAFAKRQADEATYAQQAYHGYAFEAYSTTRHPPGEDAPANADADADPDAPPGWSGTVNTNEQWCCVVKSGIADVRLYMGGEVDCVRDKWEGKMSGTVELKTNMVIGNSHQQANFEKKLLKHWAQSYLLGVPTVEVGFRTKEGILRSIQEYDTLRIPEMIAASPNAWSPQLCLDTFTYLARGVLATVLPTALTAEDGGEEVIPEPVQWRLSFQPGKGLTIRKLERLDKTYDPEGKRWGFLPMGYVELVLGV